MSLADVVMLALRSVRRRWGRATLTIIAVALASTLLTALLLISDTAQTRVLSQLSNGGPLAGIHVVPSSPGADGVAADDPARGEDRPIDDAVVARIRALPHVRRVTELVSAAVSVDAVRVDADGEHEVPRFVDAVIGIDVARARDLPISVVHGRLPAIGSRTEIAVTESFLRRLGLDRRQGVQVLGTKIAMASVRPGAAGAATARWSAAIVVGVVVHEAGSGMGVMSQEIVGDAYRWELSGVAHRGLATTYTGLFVEAESLRDVGAVRAAIADVGYVTTASEHIIETVDRYLHVVDIVLTGIGLIAAGIAAIGISNAMLSAVREREREIGVMKAIGGRDRDVLRVFLVEAAVLGGVGGILGTGCGWVVARIVGEVVNRFLTRQALSGVTLETPATTLVSSVLGAIALALLAGVVPALRAARLSAKEAVDAT